MNKIDEILLAELPLTVKNDALQILVQTHRSRFKAVHQQLVPVLEIVPVQPKLLRRRLPRWPVPPIRQQHATHIEKQRRNITQLSPRQIPTANAKSRLWPSSRPALCSVLPFRVPHPERSL